MYGFGLDMAGLLWKFRSGEEWWAFRVFMLGV